MPTNDTELEDWNELVSSINEEISNHGYNPESMMRWLREFESPVISERGIRFLESQDIRDEESFYKALSIFLELQDEPEWKQELVVKGFSPPAIDAFERLAFRKIRRKDDVLILHFSRSIPLDEVADLEKLLDSLYKQELDEPIHIRKIVYTNPVEIFIAAVAIVIVGLHVGSVAYNVYRSVTARKKSHAALQNMQEEDGQEVRLDELPEGVNYRENETYHVVGAAISNHVTAEGDFLAGTANDIVFIVEN